MDHLDGHIGRPALHHFAFRSNPQHRCSEISADDVRYHLTMNKRRFLQITKALVDSRRFEILERIAATDEISCTDLRAEFPISRATMSHHIKELAAAGLIERRRKSKYMFLRMRRKTWKGYLERLRKVVP
jgi:ArsR family transcriptional regulator, arsenate/arsenite/antimonite-responsive transcriptional repressor